MPEAVQSSRGARSSDVPPDELRVKPITYSLQFRGRATPLSPGVLAARLTAPGWTLRTTIDRDGLHGSSEASAGEEAVLRSQLSFLNDHGFEESGEIGFGNGDSLRFRTVGRGVLERSPDPHLCHGTAMWEVDGGAGRFQSARGRITSNFFVSDTGEITDNQLGVLFLHNHETTQ